MRISFVYPMFNEVGNIEKLLRATQRLTESIALEDYEIIVVDDCSTDGSGEVAENLRAEIPRLRVLHHDQNRQLGAALRTGFASARLDHILYMDSDFPVAFSEVERVLGQLHEPPDILVGYRIGRGEGLYRELQSRAYNALLRRVFGLRVRDANFAFKLFRRELANGSVRSESSFIDAELLLEAQRRGYQIREIGFHYQIRTAGKSTMAGPRVIPPLLRDLTRYRRERWLPVSARRYVIFNADDFGLCTGVNAGVIASHQGGVVRSASLIATGEAFDEAADYARNNPSLDIGLHLALCDGVPVSDSARVPSLVTSDGRFDKSWSGFLRRYLRGKISLRDVEAELRAQLEKSLACGLRISHLDSHQHLHALPGIFEIVLRLAEEHGIRAVRSPLEHSTLFNVGVVRTLSRLALGNIFRIARRKLVHSTVRTADHFLGFMHAGRWNLRNLCASIAALRSGVTEICCHPCAEPIAESIHGWRYNFPAELDALTSAQLRRYLHEANVCVTGFGEYF